MLHNKLPLKIKPIQWCRSAPPTGFKLDGELYLSEVANLLKDILPPDDHIIRVALLFSMSDTDICRIEGEISASIPLICQRCMQPMIYQLQARICVSPVLSDQQAERLPAEYEPLVCHDDEISMRTWIAEELHLGLPLAPRHEPPCVILAHSEVEAPVNPFSSLKKN